MEFLTGLPAILVVYILPALVVLTAVVFVHEMGHFLVARWCGIRVAAFSVGFGREIAGLTDRRGTRWKLSMIPLGGYVRFDGDENAASIPDPDMLAATPEAARKGLFHFAPLWQRIAVVAAGPIANFILAIAIFAAVFTLYGRPDASPVVSEVVEGSAAERAGFLPGDRIVSVDGDAIASFNELRGIVMLSAEDTLSIVVERDGREMTLTAVPDRVEQPDQLGGTQRIGVLGVRSGDYSFERDPPLQAVVYGARETLRIIDATLTYIARLVRGREGAEQLSGPVGIVQMSGVVASDGGAVGLIYLTAILSVSIGLFNLFPVPMLDGGHLLFYLIEALRGRPLSARVQDIGFRIGFALVVMLFIFVTFNDIANRLWISPSS